MQGKSWSTCIVKMIGGLVIWLSAGCLKPPERTSGVFPRVTEPPKNSGLSGEGGGQSGAGGGQSGAGGGQSGAGGGQSGAGGGQSGAGGGQSGAGGGQSGAGGGQPKPQPAVVGTFKIRYWINKTGNDNCLTIQPVGAASISSKCVSEGAKVFDYVTHEVPATADGTLTATIKIDTTENPAARKFSSATDNVGDNGWRWRCVKTEDSVRKVVRHTVCYEDGNTSSKVFASSDIFVEFEGPSSVQLTGVKCASGADLDKVGCTPK